jgi:hypothetical protein
MRETRTYGLMRGCWLARVTHGAPGSTPPHFEFRPYLAAGGPGGSADACAGGRLLCKNLHGRVTGFDRKSRRMDRVWSVS